MKLLYCHVEFLDTNGNKKGFRGLEQIDLNLSATHVFSYDGHEGILCKRLRDKPLPENFWANGDRKTNLYNVNVVAGKNGSGKSTVINYVIDLLYYIYLDFGRQETNIPPSARFDVEPNYNLLAFEENGLLYVVELLPDGSTRQKLEVLQVYEGNGASQNDATARIIRGRNDRSKAAAKFKNLFKATKVVYMMNNPTQRDYERNLNRQEGGLRNYFVYDCSLGANLGGQMAQLFPYEVYKQVKYLFDDNQEEIRKEIKQRIKKKQRETEGTELQEPDELVMPRALRIRPRITMLTDRLILQLLPSITANEEGYDLTDKDLLNALKLMSINEILGELCCRSFVTNAGGIFGEDEKDLVNTASKLLYKPSTKIESIFEEQKHCIHAVANVVSNKQIEESIATCCAVLPDGRVVGGSDDGILHIWDPNTGEYLQTLKGQGDRIRCLAVFSDGRIISGSDRGTLRIWDLNIGERLLKIEGHALRVNCLAVLCDGHIVSGSSDKTIRIWDPDTGECLRILEGHTHSVNCLAVLPNGRIVSGSDDRTIHIWDPDTGECLRTLEGHTHSVRCLTALSDGHFVSGSDDKTIRIWDLDTGECLRILEGHTNSVNCLAMLRDRRIVSGSDDKTIRIWDLDTGECLQTIEGHPHVIKLLAVLSNDHIVTVSYDGALRIWDTGVGEFLRRLEVHTGFVTCLAVLPDGRIVSGSDDKMIRIWNPDTGECLRTMAGHTRWVRCLTKLHDGCIVSGSDDKMIRIWNPDTGECLRTLKGHTDSVTCLAALPDGRIVSGSDDIRIWASDTGECLHMLKEQASFVTCLVVLSNSRIVSGSDDGILRVWNSNTGKCLWTKKGHTNWITCLAVLPDGRIVSGSRDRIIRIWDPDTGECLQTLEGHADWVTCLAVLPDGRILSGSADKKLRIWEPDTGRRLRTLEYANWIICLAVLPDGRIASGLSDKTIRVWNHTANECISILSTYNQFQSVDRLRHNCIAYLDFIASEESNDLFARFVRAGNEACCFELPLKTNEEDASRDERLQPFMTEFIQRYRYTCEPVYTIDFDWGLSSGEENMLRLFSNLFHIFDRDYSSGKYGEYRIYNDEWANKNQRSPHACTSVILFMDEADLTLHPEWQRRLIHVLTAALSLIYPNSCAKDMQLILSTHSPLLLGDIPRENVCYLGHGRSVGAGEASEETFGQNIHTLLKDSFFLDNGTIGEFASSKINGIAARLEEILRNETKVAEENSISVGTYRRPSAEELMDMRKIIDLVANGILRVWLEERWQKVSVVLGERMHSEEAETLAKDGKKLSLKERRYILHKWLEDKEL